MITQEQLEQILANPERYRAELTTSTSDTDKFCQAICAFANDLPGDGKYGYLILGVYDGGTPYFYWSKNEFQVAKHRQDNYWVYLVNRTEMNSPGYTPIMIQNPHKVIIEQEGWNKEVDKYRISAFV